MICWHIMLPETQALAPFPQTPSCPVEQLSPTSGTLSSTRPSQSSSMPLHISTPQGSPLADEETDDAEIDEEETDDVVDDADVLPP